MKTLKGDLFKRTPNVCAICIPTNGVVKINGELVMGAGVAKVAALRWPDLPRILGDHVNRTGNIPFISKPEKKR